MPFMTLNGLSIDVEHDDLERDYKDAESFARSEGMTLEGILYREVREWSFNIPAQLSDYESQAQRGWIKGRGHYWTFERTDGATTRFNKYSSDGGPGFGSGITNTATSKFGTWGGVVSSGGSSTVTATFGSENKYSVSVWKLENGATGAWKLCSMVADGTTTTSYAGTAVTTSFAWASISAVSGYLSVTLQGENNAGTAKDAAYDGLMMLPYALTTAQLSALSNRTAALPQFPYIELDGDMLEDPNPITVKGFVVDEQHREATKQGTSVIVRTPAVKLVER